MPVHLDMNGLVGFSCQFLIGPLQMTGNLFVCLDPVNVYGATGRKGPGFMAVYV
jgi:hypothetical protein